MYIYIRLEFAFNIAVYCVSTFLITTILISYSMYNGIETMVSVIKSGGVIIADTIIIHINACLLYFANIQDCTIPILVRMKAIMGNWKTNPIINVSDVNVDTYESIVIELCTRSATLYVPKNLNEIGNKI